jgi:hypothetical protein
MNKHKNNTTKINKQKVGDENIIEKAKLLKYILCMYGNFKIKS